MIFVTVGTHEQDFNRLIEKVDELVHQNKLENDVFMQIGYSTYKPRYTNFTEFLGYDEMSYYLNKSEVIITHGGPSTYMHVLQLGKIPVVVPRQEKFKEHVNDHQLFVSKQVRDKGYPIIICEDIDYLLSDIQKSKSVSSISKNSNNQKFVSELSREISKIFKM
ncbi:MULTISPECIES: glycosyltransferase [Lactococcus]|uniref:glycosyltransferase n=1 Tax=Lactococcus TaxID=1357 RepID=UPI00038B41D3|nr:MULTISPECIES: glycosyltransferase [Lactococcus]EQC89185.1 hypothetical protein LLDT4_00855 [Lactococcus lactis subsp. lactis bv. diacetylactis str. TIFN4]MCT4431375.1 multidrug MFS transporter [Lactococcus cremoris]